MLRDYLTDLFPIMALSISAKILSIVPLMAAVASFGPVTCPNYLPAKHDVRPNSDKTYTSLSQVP